MLNFPSDAQYEPKYNVTHGTMGRLDPKQPPVKRKPFSALLNQHFANKAEFILPEEVYETVKDTLFDALSPKYRKVILPLKALLEGQFFNEYIKKGNILMLSEGRFGVDNVYTLREGLLSLYLDKESYERAGLIGHPHGVKGKRGTKSRWVIEINLRLPSMLHGKKGFERLVYAAKNVLTKPVTWLFCNACIETPSPDPLEHYSPIEMCSVATVAHHIKTTVPILRPAASPNNHLDGSELEEFAVDIYEWLSLISLGSPRIDPDDRIDPFLSRYAPPAGLGSESSLVRVTWQGLMTSSWVHLRFVQALGVIPHNAWFAYSVVSSCEAWPQESRNCMVLKVPDLLGEYVLWESA